MMLLAASFWPGIAGAAGLGLLVGWLAGWPARPAVPLALGAATVLLVALAVAGPVPGTPGLWLEAAGLMLPPYLGGSILGALIRRLSARA